MPALGCAQQPGDEIVKDEGAENIEPRWSVVKDVLHWTD